MKRLLVIILTFVMLPSVLNADLLVAVCEPPSSDMTGEQSIVNKELALWFRVCGLMDDIKFVRAADTTALYTAASSGDYRALIYINLPDFDADLNTALECRAAGCGNMGFDIRPADTSVDIDQILFVPEIVYDAAGGIFDSTGMVANYDMAYVSDSTYQVMLNQDGDSLFGSLHPEKNNESLVDTALSTVEVVSYRRCAFDSTLISPYCWRFTKDDGYHVWIAPHCDMSFQSYTIAFLLALYEPNFLPVQFSYLLFEGGTNGTTDTAGLGTNLSTFLAYVEDNGLKIDFAINESLLDTCP